MKKKSIIISIVSIVIGWVAFLANYFINSVFDITMLIILIAISISILALMLDSN